AQRRLTTHGHQVLALAAVQAAVFDGADLLRIATREHLRDQAIVVGHLIARRDALKRVPVIGKDLFEDTPVPRGCCQHPRPPREGVGIVAVPWLYHVSSALSMPPPRLQGVLLHRCGNCLQSNHKKCNFLCYRDKLNETRSFPQGSPFLSALISLCFFNKVGNHPASE